jgi:hypothetical protein
MNSAQLHKNRTLHLDMAYQSLDMVLFQAFNAIRKIQKTNKKTKLIKFKE